MVLCLETEDAELPQLKKSEMEGLPVNRRQESLISAAAGSLQAFLLDPEEHRHPAVTVTLQITLLHAVSHAGRLPSSIE